MFSQEKLNNVRLPDEKGEQLSRDFIFFFLHQAAQIVDEDPCLVFSFASTSPMAPKATAESSIKFPPCIWVQFSGTSYTAPSSPAIWCRPEKEVRFLILNKLPYSSS